LAGHDDEEGELIIGRDGSAVRVVFAGEHVALVLLTADAMGGRGRVELTPESASRLAVELELAAGSLVHERRRRPIRGAE